MSNSHKASNLIFGVTKLGLYLGGYFILRRALKRTATQEEYYSEDDENNDESQEIQNKNTKRLEYLIEQDYLEAKHRLVQEYADGEKLAQMNSEKSYNAVKLLVINSQSAAENMIISNLHLPEEIVKDFLGRLEYDGIVSSEYPNTKIREVLVDRFGLFHS